MKWLVDTDVLSQAAKKDGDSAVIKWLEKEQANAYTSAINIAQLARWVRSKEGRQREKLQTWLTRLINAMQGRILGYNVSVAHVWAEQQIQFEEAGCLMPVEDSYITAIARRHDLTIVTGNEKDFDRPGVKVFNPFKQRQN